MIIPLVNAIFDGNIDINEFYKKSPIRNLTNLIFRKVPKKTFKIIKIKKRISEYPATPIIINAANEVLVSQFLAKKIPYLSISKTILRILNDLNYKKYAIKKPKNIKEIIKIDKWTREHIKKIKI